MRNRGIQWGLTIVEVDKITKKTTAVDLQFLPYNCRSAEVITPVIVQRMMPGGTLSTDCLHAYRTATQAAEVTHLTVNHSETFRDPDTGVHTNNVEGIHGVIKKDARRQFGRLPYLTEDGQTYYLDLLGTPSEKKISYRMKLSLQVRVG